LKRYGLFLVVLGAMLWGTDSLFRRPLTGSFSPVTLVFLEHCVLVAITLPLILKSRAEVRAMTRKDWAALSVIALGGSVAATSLFTYAIKYGNPSVTVLLQKTQPLLTLLLARILLGEKPKPWFWRWLGPAMAGAYLVSTPDWSSGFSLQSSQTLSVVAALGASLFWGASTVFGRYVVTRLPVMVLTGMRFAIALPALLILYRLQSTPERAVPRTAAEAMALAAMALIPGLLALVFYYRGLQSTPASLAAVGELAFPITAVVTNRLILGVHLSAIQSLGGLLLVASVTAFTILNARQAPSCPLDGDSDAKADAVGY